MTEARRAPESARGYSDTPETDLGVCTASNPDCVQIALNAHHRLIADGLEWVVQRRCKDVGRGGWQSIIWCQTKAGLMACMGYEVFQVGKIDSARISQIRWPAADSLY